LSKTAKNTQEQWRFPTPQPQSQFPLALTGIFCLFSGADYTTGAQQTPNNYAEARFFNGTRIERIERIKNLIIFKNPCDPSHPCPIKPQIMTADRINSGRG
jgi:hypothetical protein